MKIAYITPSLNKCGPNVVLSNTIDGFNNNNNIQCDIFYLKDTKDNIKFKASTYKITSLFELYKQMKNHDIIHSNGFIPDFIAFLFKVISFGRIKIITTVHNNVYHDLYYSKGLLFSVFFGSLWCLLFVFFDKRTFLSKCALKYYKFLNGNKKNIVVSNSIEQNKKVIDLKLRDKYNLPDDSILIGSCANITKRKGLDIIISNMKPYDNIYYIIIGDGIEKNNLINIVQDNNLKNKVFFVNFEPEPLDYICSFDFFMMPSRNEGFGLTILESLSVSTPVICSNLDVFQELYQGMVSFIDGDKFDLSLVLHTAMISKEVQLRCSSKRIKEEYSVDVMCNKLDRIYKSMIFIKYRD
ncbi:hypothetical protein C9J21_19765 [Photobacterium phosphoreum]|uniref:glycosyltransferase family 4 protein n=1 Tax=Photobacterium phosphoreum TaxID=659 RepID=UPI000D164DAF|nr:glycosyltransferase family 4 protein [Photobacterium phosphoreum]PSW29341.1 hypothetical protein C9J21_19765 [Photobacterium phosphoreum]